MKTTKMFRLATITMMFVAFAVFSANAGKPALTPADHVQKIIKESIKYPEQALRHCCTGSVDVYFIVDDEGKIKIEQTYSDNPEIERLLKKQLSDISCKGIKIPYNEHYKVTITFKLVG